MKRTILVFVGLLLFLAAILSACGPEDAPIAVGSPAPDFSLTASDGTQVSLSNYQGQPVLLFFHMAGG